MKPPPKLEAPKLLLLFSSASRFASIRADPAMSLEGVMSSMGKSRDIDGSVDRIPPPPEEMWAILYAIQRKCEDENINLEGAMEEGGGNHYGMMKLTQFKSTLKTNLPRFHITEDTFERISSHYGCGYKNPRGYRESIAWKDFCEDVHDAMDITNGKAQELAATRGGVLDLKSLL